MARSRRSCTLAAGTDRISRGSRADQSVAHFRGHETVSVVGDRERANPKRDALRREDPSRQTLRFSKSGDPTIEILYRTHWISGELSERRRERLVERASRAPELLVIQPLNDTWKCHCCSGTGDLLIMESPGPACLRCAGLDDLEFLSAGDALLTRRVKAKSARHAVVVRFSKTRRRYERQGLLVESHALAEGQRELDRQNRG
jgi:hypothetical protein